ncbi:MAG: hypothetical protein V2A65_01370 [Candidatus Omnitrophota bacterium]
MGKMIIKFVCLVGFMASLMGVSLVSHAQEIIKLADDRQVEKGKNTEFQFDLKEIPKGKQTRLYLDARIEWEGLGGNTGAMSVFVNEQGVVGRNLLNKPLRFTMREGSELDWAAKDGAGYRLMYAPDFSDRLKTDENYIYGLGEPDQDPFHFVWDITSLVRVGINSVQIRNDSGLSFSLRFRDVGVEIGDPIPSLNIDASTQPAPTGRLPVYVPEKRAETPMKINVSQNGNIRFKVGVRNFDVSSRTSLPNGEWSDDSNMEDVWSQIERGKSIIAKWEGLDYTVERKVTLHSDHISVADTVCNTGQELVGVIFENRLKLPEEEPEKTLLGGFTGMKQRSNAAHPTAMAQFKNLAIGLVAEDDIFRYHGKLFEETGYIGLSDPSLGIAPGKAHTLEWSIYMAPKGDYWDFINAIRRNWGSNFTLQGPLIFPPADIFSYITAPNLKADDLREWLDQMNNSVKMVITHVAVNPNISMATATKEMPAHKHGTAILDAKAWLDNTRKLVQEMKKVDPTVKVFAYTHKNLCTEVGYEQKYQDSVALNAEGNPIHSVYVPEPGTFMPTLENSYGKAMMEVYKYLVENLDANIYIDEINHAFLVPGDGDTIWDGCTVIINPVSHAVTRKQSSPPLLIQPWLASLMEYLKSKEKTVIANGNITSRTMLNWDIQCFVEDGMGRSAIILQHLGTPLAWAGYFTGRPGYDHLRESLDVAGIAFTRSGEWNDHTFPITPIELRAGVVIGEERILTNRSGQFGWGDDSQAEVYVFDGQGNRVKNPNIRELRNGKQVLTEIRMPGDYLAILVRKKN